MRSSFVIYLLPIIMIGNVLHTMEVDLATDLELSTDEVLKINVEGVELDSSNSIKTMVNMQSLAKQLIANQIASQKKRSRKDRFSEAPEFEIPDRLEVNPQVFDEYVDMKKVLPKEPEPGLLRRIFCCRSKKKNRFEYAHDNMAYNYENWAKDMLTILCCEQDQQDKQIKTRIFLADRDNENSDAEELEKTIQILRKQLRKEKRQTKKLKTENELHKKLRDFCEQQRESDNSNDKWKGVAYTFLTIAGAFLSGVYGVG